MVYALVPQQHAQLLLNVARGSGARQGCLESPRLGACTYIDKTCFQDSKLTIHHTEAISVYPR